MPVVTPVPWFQCTIEMPSMMADLTTAPVNCSMCADIHSVDRVANITPQEFEQKYVYLLQPTRSPAA